LAYQTFAVQGVAADVHNVLHLEVVIFAMYKDVVLLPLAEIFVLQDILDHQSKLRFVI
jgi:hypothetical protein